MQEQDLNCVSADASEAAAAEMRQVGLRALARMIARLYARDSRVSKGMVPEHDEETLRQPRRLRE